MSSNVYTKNEILQNLASKGYFIDSYTLDTFFEKWRVEAIFEDEQGSEFYDKNALDLVLNNLFNAKNEEKEENEKEPSAENKEQQAELDITPDEEKLELQEPELKIDDSETAQILSNISLSDGTPLINEIQKDTNEIDISSQPKIIDIEPVSMPSEKQSTVGILEGAMLASGQEFTKDTPAQEFSTSTDETSDFDDISLLSESLEAQEKFKEYVLSELSKKNVDLAPKSNEFKLDISERTLSMIARSMAKKIAKHVSSICSADAKSAAKLADIQDQNKRLEQRTRDLEEQNKKLRLLLAESNKNLNSYKPSIFGLYKKVNPNKQ